MSAGGDDIEEGCFGDMFGCEAENTAANSETVDIEFLVDRSAWIAEGVPVDAQRYTQHWPTLSEPAKDVASAPLKELKLFRKDKHHSLWGHKIWNAAKYLSKKMESGSIAVAGLSVLELGAGLGVPALVAHQLGARVVVTTDYPDEDLLSILRKNVAANRCEEAPASTVFEVKPLLWGNREHMEACMELVGNGCGFDVLILSDIVFNHVCHDQLLKTVATCMAKDRRAAAYCAFSHHRPRKVEDDLSFFEKAKAYGLTWEKVDEEIYPLMFPDDPGPVEIRAPVHCFRLQHYFDEAGPPVDFHVDYDVVVQGTGLTETLLSAALSRHGLRVLHLDNESAYGGAFNTLEPQAFTKFVSERCRNVNVTRSMFSNEVELNGAMTETAKYPTEFRENPFLVKRFQLDTVPLMFLSQGDLVSTLVESEGARNMEFQNVDRVLLATFPNDNTNQPTLRLHRMPLSRSDVFASKEFSPMEMRRLMKFVKDVEATLAESEHAHQPQDGASTSTSSSSVFSSAATAEDKDFLTFLRRKYQLSAKSANLLTMFGALQHPPPYESSNANECIESSVKLMRTFLTSVGRFGGETPFLAANYGSAELPQNMCRMSAVWNGTFILRRWITNTWRTDRKAFATLSNNQTIETKAVVAPSADNNVGGGGVRLVRCALILSKPLITWDTLREQLQDLPSDETDESLRQQSIPIVLLTGGINTLTGQAASLDDTNVVPIAIHQLGYATMQAPQSPRSVLVHLTADATQCSMDVLTAFTKGLLSSSHTEDDVWFQAFFEVDGGIDSPNVNISIGRGEETASTPQDHVFRVKPLFNTVDDGEYLREAKRVFEAVVAHCEDFGFDPWSRAPFPGGVTSAEAKSDETTKKSTPQFLPPPPEEIAAQAATVGEADSDAALLADAARRLALKKEEDASDDAPANSVAEHIEEKD